MKFLVIQQKRVGDVLISTIICNNLKKKYPNSTIDFMCYANSVDVLIGNQNIDNVIVLSHKVRKSYFSLFKFIFEIRAKKYDAVIDVYNKLETNLITLFTGANIKVAYHKWYTSLFYTHNLKRFDNTKNTNYGLAIENRLLLLAPFNIDKNIIDPYPKLFVSDKENEDTLSLFEQHRVNKNNKIIMISLLGSEENKTYPLEYMARVVDYVANNNDVTILFNYFQNQIEDAKKIYNSCSKDTQEKIHFDLLGDDLRSFIAIMNQCDVIIGNDGGAINMAKALNKPSFTIFSPFVEKKIWATFEDGLKNISVHINDFKPELIVDVHHDEIKKNAFSVYQQFPPELFKEQIKFFLEQNLVSI
ncbi:glycosyltransferase family 9 protein [Flavobacterium taihuense]|uniref:Glycosyltransferase family 9 protein n=1 Tax=Flavobacterium taihuense TaxID=2857508 RepID=A0ABS6XVS3_9FLAO|nr:glycosyltransferase family 9 protein [Flavobacterium taihuense]MBW4360779.1 glycosyltransferase family 9 protein [Flavobacterium taihuense]